MHDRRGDRPPALGGARAGGWPPASAMPLIVWLAWRFAERRDADLARHPPAAGRRHGGPAEESVVGIEMVQAFGREDTVRERFDGRAALVRDGLRRRRATSRRATCRSDVPDAALGRRGWCCWSAACGSSTGTWRSASSSSSKRSCSSSRGHSRRSAGSSTSASARSARPAAASPGSTAWALARGPDPAGRACPDGPLGVRLAGGGLRLPGASDGAAGRRPRRRAGRGRRASPGPPRAARAACSGLVPRFYDPTAGALPDRRPGRAGRLRVAELRGAVAIVTPAAGALLAPRSARTSRWPGRTRRGRDVPAGGDAAGVAGLRRRPARRATTRRIGERGVNLSGGQRQRVALARAHRLRTPASSCSTTRSRRSTP